MQGPRVGIGQLGSRVPTPGAVRGCARKSVPENRRAIRDLLSFYANSEAELPRELAPPIRAWIRGYVGSDSEPILRHLYDRISMSVTTQGSSQPGEVNRRLTAIGLRPRSPQHAVSWRPVRDVGELVSPAVTADARAHCCVEQRNDAYPQRAQYLRSLNEARRYGQRDDIGTVVSVRPWAHLRVPRSKGAQHVHSVRG